MNWQGIIKCRIFKQKLTTYLFGYFIHNIRLYLAEGQQFVTSGATESSESIVTKTEGAYIAMSSIIESHDTRLWLHLNHSTGPK